MRNRHFLTGMMWCIAIALSAEEQPQPLRVPDGFDGIQLGMSVAQVVNIRTNVKPFALLQSDVSIDPNISNQLLFERVPRHSIFNFVLYNFTGNELDTIVFVGRTQGAAMPKRIEEFLAMSVTVWGKADEAFVVGLDDPKGATQGAPALLWKKSNAIVVAAHTSVENQERLGRGILQVKIIKCVKADLVDATRAMNVVKKVFSLPVVGAERMAQILGTIQNRVIDASVR